MNILLWIACVVGTLRCVHAFHGSFKSCYECAEKYPKNYICDFGDTIQDKWRSSCCSPDNKSPYCKKSYFNKCSGPFDQDGALFYSHCRRMNKTMCGTKTDDMSFTPNLRKRKFTFKKLHRYENYDGKPDQFDACTYTIQAPDGLYSQGTIRISFPKLQNVEVFVNGGKSKKDASTVIVKEPKENASVTASFEKEYDIDLTEKLFVTVLPKKNAETTNFQIYYQIIGPEPPFYIKFYNDHFTGPDGFKTLIVFGSCLACLLFLFLCCICICCRRCCKKRKQDNDSIPDANKVQSLDIDYSPKQDKPQIHANLELESMSERGSGDEQYMYDNTNDFDNSLSKMRNQGAKPNIQKLQKEDYSQPDNPFQQSHQQEMTDRYQRGGGRKQRQYNGYQAPKMGRNKVQNNLRNTGEGIHVNQDQRGVRNGSPQFNDY